MGDSVEDKADLAVLMELYCNPWEYRVDKKFTTSSIEGVRGCTDFLLQ